MAAVLDDLGIAAVHLVGHDWGAAVAWLAAAYLPHRVRTLTAVSVPHPLAEQTLRQREMAWYQLFFQFEGIAEATITDRDWALLREWAHGYKDIDRAIENLSRPDALTASLNWYRANLAPRMPGPPPRLPPVTAPTLAIWSDGDRYLDGARVRASGEFVSGRWRYEEIAGATHWIPLDAPERLNDLLLRWFAENSLSIPHHNQLSATGRAATSAARRALMLAACLACSRTSRSLTAITTASVSVSPGLRTCQASTRARCRQPALSRTRSGTAPPRTTSSALTCASTTRSS